MKYFEYIKLSKVNYKLMFYKTILSHACGLCLITIIIALTLSQKIRAAEGHCFEHQAYPACPGESFDVGQAVRVELAPSLVFSFCGSA